MRDACRFIGVSFLTIIERYSVEYSDFNEQTMFYKATVYFIIRDNCKI